MKKVLNKLLMFFQFLLFAVLFMGISYYGFTDLLPDAWNGNLGYLQILKPFYLLFMGTLTTVLGLVGLVGLYAAFGSLFSKEN